MKKLLSFIAVMAINASAYTLNIQPGWQLKGALSDINASQLNNSNIRSVWTYDSNTQKWRAYLPNNSSLNLSKYGIENLQKIEEGEGFWVNAKSNVSVNIPSEMNNNNGSQGQGQISLTNLNFTPLAITDNDFNNKLVLTSEPDISIINFDSNGTYEREYYDGKVIKGNWNIKDNVLSLNGGDMILAVEDKNGSLLTVKGTGLTGGVHNWTDEEVILKANKNTIVNSASDYLDLFDSNTPIKTISSSNFSNKTLQIADNEKITFKNDGTFTDSWIVNGQTKTESGNWSISGNKVLVLNHTNGEDDGMTTCFVFINNKAIFIDVNSNNGKIMDGGVTTIN